VKIVDPMHRLVRILALAILLTLTHFSSAQGDTLPDSFYISGVSGHAQRYSLSCESRSAADLADFWGLSISEGEFLNALPRADNPENGFVGDPNDVWGRVPPAGYGVHAGPVASTLREFGLEAEAHNNLMWDDLREEIEAGHPVVVWVIGQMWDGKAIEYEAPDGSSSVVAAFEHTMILVGYSPESVQVVDAYTGQYQTYPLNTFLRSWAVLGNMAVFSSRDTPSNDAPATEAHGETYTVQQGEYLIALADRVGTTWQELVDLNSIAYPYTIFPGQVLILPVEEPQPTEPPPPVNKVTLLVRLPMVYQNYAVQSTQSGASSPSNSISSDTVIVQHAMTLFGFARRYGIDWHLLAKLNDLHPPYILLPGQQIRLR
jgi:LysM repeat protein/uncharacterized protein YvpB